MKKNHKPPCIEVKPDMRVSLTIERKSGPDEPSRTITLHSVIEEVMDDGCLLIHMPLHHGHNYPLPRDSGFLMHFFIGSRMFALPVRFQERVIRDNLLFARVQRTGAITSGQRRDCFRLPCSLRVIIERQSINEQSKPSVGQMIDFSDGGMLFLTNEDIGSGEMLTLTFNTGGIETVKATALRAERMESGQHRYRVAVQFKCKDKAQKQRFYKYIVKQQAEELKRQTQGAMPLYPHNNKGGV